MGAAKSKRDRIFSAREADEKLDESKRHYFEVLDRINNMKKGVLRPFGAVVIVPPQGNDCHWWLMEAGPDRHYRYAFCYPNLRSLMKSWSLVVTGFSKDKAGAFYTTEAF